MIVMKFGGSSLASPAALERVVSIIRSQAHRNPAVVVSALGDTTDHLVEIARAATQGNAYALWKLQKELKEYHFSTAEHFCSGFEGEQIDQFIRDTFRDLHVRMLEVCEGETSFTPALNDWVLSMGEQLSSRIIASVLRALNVPALHLDSRSLILTDEHFTRATPQYWETYAKIRWTVPVNAQRNVVVLGGFIGATEKGETTTLGRGGSDLTASMIGAAVNAEEIQIWKDVDGMLTCDPRLKAGGLRLRTLSYAEAAELAQAGAQILHPDTIAPARRLRIPVIIRNTFRPEGEGTSIVPSVPDSPNAVKSIVCQRNKTILEIRSTQAEMDSSELAQSLTDYVATQRSGIGFSVFSDGAMYISLDQVAEHRHLDLNSTHCLQVHIRPEQAIFTLVGRNIGSHSGMLQQLAAISRSYSALVLEPEPGSHAVRLIVPNPYAQACLESLHRQFFTDIDPALFARTKPVAQTRIIPSGPVVEHDSLPLRLRLLLTQKQAVLPK